MEEANPEEEQEEAVAVGQNRFPTRAKNERKGLYVEEFSDDEF